MKKMEWYYYNHAMLPNIPPHEEVDVRAIEDGSIWHMGGGRALLTRWTSDFDCKYETGWYYCIKDIPFNLKKIKSKYRCDINKGRRYFSVAVIDPKDYVEDIYNIVIV